MPIVVNGTTLTDLKVGNTDITKVYARNGITGAYILVFEKSGGGGGGTTMALFFGGNWKMNNLKADIDAYFSTFNSALELNENKRVVIFPPACYLEYTKSKIASNLRNMVYVGAQMISNETRGAYTGQLSANMIKDCGCTDVLVGQAECREYLGITNTDCNRQVQQGLSADLTVWLCVGETLEIREADTYEDYITNQLQEAFSGVAPTYFESGKVVINYEPIWAIGTGKTFPPEEADRMCMFIKQWVSNGYGDIAADKTEVVYGGSVKVTNIEELISKPNINGTLAGGIALKAEDFATIINIAGNR